MVEKTWNKISHKSNVEYYNKSNIIQIIEKRVNGLHKTTHRF